MLLRADPPEQRKLTRCLSKITKPSWFGFATYLGAKGYLPTFVRSKAASEGILLFARRGKADEERCRARITACVPVCTGQPDAGAMTCMEKCRNAEPACPPLARCANDKLPF